MKQKNIYTDFGGSPSNRGELKPLKTKQAQLVEDGSQAHLSLNTVETSHILHAKSTHLLPLGKKPFSAEEKPVQ